MKTFKIKLFYSYCHKDTSHRKDMEKSLTLLRRDGIIDDWHDEKLIPGQKFNSKIKEKIEEANIVVFLVSPDFLQSDACMEEWDIAEKQAEITGQTLIPIIIRKCDWKNFENMKDYLALPQKGKPVISWSDRDEAWQDVCEGIRKVIEVTRNTFSLKSEFKKEISSVEFLSSGKDNIQLEDLFVFPHISTELEDDDIVGKPIITFEEIIKNKCAIIRGDDQSGKTTFCRKLFLHLVTEGKPVIFIDLDEISKKKPQDNILKKFYKEQFNGDYSAWEKQKNKTIILDNLSGKGKGLEHISFVKEKFENVFVATSNDYFYAYFKYEQRLSTFTEIKINPLKGTHQEQLIRKWMKLSEGGEIEDGKIDQMENLVNSVTISNKILPRYPFFILSILQTQEAFMPSNSNISIYGDCYHALIVAHLTKKLNLRKEDIDSCFNFLEKFAFFIYEKGNNLSINKEDYNEFEQSYGIKFIKKDIIVKRLHDGIISETSEGFYRFSWPYSYYFFLGRYLTKDIPGNKKLVKKMIAKVYLRDNLLSIIFTIHHASDTKIIEEILTHTHRALGSIQPAKLDYKETKIFSDLLNDIPKRITSEKSVEEERRIERENRDMSKYDTPDHEHESHHETINEIYKLLKNMEILSQILKNKYGSLEQDVLANITETMSDAGLRLIKLLLLDEKGVNEFVQFLEKKWEEENYVDSNKISKSKQIKYLDKLVRIFLFLGTINIIEKCVYSVNKKEIRKIVKNISTEKNTPAYDLIHYFYSLNTADKFEVKHKKLLENILSKNKADDGVLSRILSIKTQIYFNTHKVKEPLKQSVLHLLKIPTKQKRLPQTTKQQTKNNSKNR